MTKDKKVLTVSFVLVIAVIAILVFITINHKNNLVPGDNNAQVDLEQNQNINMQQQTAQPEAGDKGTQSVDGVKITILKEGQGREVKAGDIVAMNYTGTLTDGTVFDSNTDKKFGHVEPFIFQLGAGQVIKGWDIGVSGMKLGEKRKLVINPEYGYGASGAGGIIPPNATLAFEVELVGIKQ